MEVLSQGQLRDNVFLIPEGIMKFGFEVGVHEVS